MKPHDTSEELKKRIVVALDALLDVQALLPPTPHSMSEQQLKISVETAYAYRAMMYALKVTNEGIDE